MAEDIKVVIFHVHAADLDGAGLGVVQARNELDQAGFRAARAADDASVSPGLMENVISFSTGWPEPCLY